MKTTASFLTSMAEGIRAFRSLVQTKGGRQKETRYRNLVAYALAYRATDLSIQNLDTNISELRTKLPSAAKTLQQHQNVARQHLLKVRKHYFGKVHRMIDVHAIDEYNKIRKLMGLPVKKVGIVSKLRSGLTLRTDPALEQVRKKLKRTSA